MSFLVPNVEQAQFVNATIFRELDAFEEFFWLLEQSVPVFHAVVAEVNGATTLEQWKDALDAIQIRYPLLSASIRKTIKCAPNTDILRSRTSLRAVLRS
jgi:hypothetical protein